jgi:hypothetical protein
MPADTMRKMHGRSIFCNTQLLPSERADLPFSLSRLNGPGKIENWPKEAIIDLRHESSSSALYIRLVILDSCQAELKKIEDHCTPSFT